MPTAEKKLSAKQRQLEINKSRKRWMTVFSVAAGLGILLLASLAWQNADRDDAQNAPRTTVHESRSVAD